MKQAFAPGDIVEPKSGGLPMTVVGVNPQGVNCQWQDAHGRPQSAAWNAIALTRSEKHASIDAPLTPAPLLAS